MELSDLSVFTAVAEEGGITRAAERLCRVPSNVTARIKKLEKELGKDLFIRDNNRLRISPAGEQLLGYARDILNLAQQAVNELHISEPQGTLKLGSMEAAAATRLAQPLMTYHQNYPKVSLEVDTNPTGLLIEQVLAGDIDMALVADPPKDERLAIEPVFKETLVLVSDLQHNAIASPKDLASNASLLGFSASCAYRSRLADWLKEGDIAARVTEISSYHTLLSCVMAGMGVGIVPQALLDIYPFAAAIKTHRLPARLRHSTSCVIWRKDSLKPSISAFADTIIREL